MGSYETTIDTLAGELARIEAAFRGLTGPEWDASTLLVPVAPERSGNVIRRSDLGWARGAATSRRSPSAAG